VSRRLVTFDLFSALIDSRMGASAVLDGLARVRGWPIDGGALYDAWDVRNKTSQRELTTWVPFAEHCRRAVAGTYAELDLPADADAVLTSQRLRAYKPGPEIYRRARERAGGALVHVATSSRDVRGALEAGIDVIHLRRSGHALDASGPVPDQAAGSLAEVGQLLG
jgi:2-haloacid dehalogenase